MAPAPSPCNKSVIPLTTEESPFKISPAASLKPNSPSTDESFCAPTVKLFINASSVLFKDSFFASSAPAAPAETCKDFAN